MNDFYTYAYLREDKTPYYIGKGKGRRAYQRHKRGTQRDFRPKNNKGKTDFNRILILKKNITEEHSIKHEEYMISLFGRKDLGTGILRNLTDGGQRGGTPGYVCPEERKKQISKQFKGIPQDKEFIERRAESVRRHYNSDEGKKTIEYLNKKKEEYFASKNGKERLLDLSKRWSGKNNPGYGGRFSGEKNGMYGKKHTEERKRKISEAGKGRGAKTYEFYNPEGKKVIIHNMTKFCKDNNLPQTVMASVATGKRKHHIGWTIDKNFCYTKKSYIVIDPNGKNYLTENLTQFCKEYNLSYSAMNNVLHGISKQHKGGWTVKRRND